MPIVANYNISCHRSLAGGPIIPIICCGTVAIVKYY